MSVPYGGRVTSKHPTIPWRLLYCRNGEFVAYVKEYQIATPEVFNNGLNAIDNDLPSALNSMTAEEMTSCPRCDEMM